MIPGRGTICAVLILLVAPVGWAQTRTQDTVAVASSTRFTWVPLAASSTALTSRAVALDLRRRTRSDRRAGRRTGAVR